MAAFNNNWTVVSVILLVVGATYVTSLRCYVCNSRDNSECLAPPKNFTEEEYQDNSTIAGRLLQECPPKDDEGREAHCRTQYLIVLGGNDPDMSRLWRECGYHGLTKPCQKIYNGGHKERVCQCFTDGCNNDPPPKPTLTEILFNPNP